MRSKANFKSHPIHPMLVPFPLAFLLGSFFFHLISLVLKKDVLWTLGSYLSLFGIIAAVAAAIPGAIDYFYTIPPDSSAQKRGTKHAIVNLSAVFLFIIALLLHTGGNAVSPWMITAIELAGAGLLSVGGWLGGTLSYRNQIGVDHRYAGAGKWKEEHFNAPSGQKVAVAKTDELKVNQMKLVHLNNKRIVIARTEKNYVAFEDRCTHKGGSLAGGAMMCGTVQCPWHGSQFDVHTGAAKEGPATAPISTFTLQEENGKLYLIM